MEVALNDFSVGSLIWISSSTTEWKDAEILSLNADNIEVRTLDDQFITIKRESQDYKSMSESSKNGVDDMITLSELNEGSLLRNLRIRFEKDVIYTYTGSIVVALNPYKSVPLYTQEQIRQYKGEKIGALSPHIFAIGDDAYRELVETEANKSILISGESGAGKTETTKLILQYLTHLSGSHSSVEQLLIESSPILEAFGNAKTSINDNSSRFGKYMEVFFSPSGTILGGKIEQYLLEKSRIVTQPKNDRNYHVFYTLVTGSSPTEKEEWSLKEVTDYKYLSEGSKVKVEHNDSPKAFQNLKSTMSIVGFSPESQNDVFKVVSAILNLGNIHFKNAGDDVAEIENRNQLEITAKLLQVPVNDLEEALICHQVKTGKDVIKKNISVSKAEATRDTIARTLYGRLFSWIVSEVNEAMKVKKSAETETEYPSVGVLDIFGFETVETNSFEQFCINLANETLQSFFNIRIFQMEQEEYEKEGISWKKINFVDNSLCLKVLYKGKLSLLNLLDEESNFPSASDDTLVAKFHENNSDAECYEKPHGLAKEFTIVHYAGKVTYNTIGFLEKNSDSLNDGIISVFTLSSSSVIKSWFEKDQDLLQLRGTLKKSYKSPTVGGQFKESLNLLMQKLEATDPYFIRCIKPNAEKSPSVFNSDLVLKQLRNTGMLETIRIRRLGYPLRLTFEEFYQRYFMLKQDPQQVEPKDKALAIVIEMQVPSEDYQVGNTTIFMRIRAQRFLDEKRHKIMVEASFKLSSFAKAMVTRKGFLKKKTAIVTLQRVYRGTQARRDYTKHKESAIEIQRMIRGYLQRKKYLALRKSLPILLRSLTAMACRGILLQKKIQADKDAELDAIEKKKQEEALAKKLAEQEAERQKLIEEEKKRQALLENPGFQIIGLKQEKLTGENQITFSTENENQYSFQKYATTYFRSNLTMEYSDVEVTGGLLAKIPEEEIEKANSLQQIFRSFIACSSLVEERKILENIKTICLSSSKLTDELYCNLVKYTYHNVNVANVLRGWYLIASLLCFLAPSDELERYLTQYIVNRGPEGYASYCFRLTQKFKINGPRSSVPSNLELKSVRDKTKMEITVISPNQSSQVNVHSYSLGSEVAARVSNILNMTSETGFSLLVNGKSIGDNEYIMDAISSLEEIGAQETNFTFSFRKQVLLPEEPRSSAQNSFAFDQIMLEFLNEIIPVELKDAVSFAIINFLVSGGKKEDVGSMPMNKKYLPSTHLSQSESEWKELLQSTSASIFQDLKDFSQDTLKSKAIDIAEHLPLFFGQIFSVKQTDGPTISPNKFYLMVNLSGIHAIQYQGQKRELISTLSYNEITELGLNDNIITLQFGSTSYTFEIPNAFSFKDLVETYMIALKEKATLFVSIEAHKVSDPLLLNFSKGTIIKLVPTDEVAVSGWAKGECNSEFGMFPLQSVEGLVGTEVPSTKEALLFQVSLSSSEKAKAKPTSEKWTRTLNHPKKMSVDSIPDRTPTIPAPVDDPKLHFIEFAKKYFIVPKRSKHAEKTTLSRLATKKDRKNSTGQIFGSIKFQSSSSLKLNPEVEKALESPPSDSAITIHDISYSSDPLKLPLMQGLEGKKNIKLAISISTHIMRCMGDYPSKKDWKEHVTSTIEVGIECPEIRDETFCQVMKQVTNNTRIQSLEKGWILLNLLCGSFPPSETMFPYLRNFIYQHVSDQEFSFQDLAIGCVSKLERTSVNGPRQFPPIPLEFDSLITKRPIVLKVYFPDHSSRSFHLDSAMTSNELLRRVHRKLDSDQAQWPGCALYITTDTFEMSLPSKAYLFDGISLAGVQHSGYRLVFKKKLWLGKEDTSSDALNNIIYHQILPSYLRGLLVCPVADPFEHIQETAFLAALQYKASEDDQRKNHNFGELFKTYLPDHLFEKKSRDEWTETILSAYTSLLNGKSQADAKAMFIDAVRKWPFYGSSFFLVKQTFEPSIPENLVMCVNIKGISLLDPSNKNILMSYKIGEIASWTYGPKHFSMKIHDLQSGDKFIFHTTSGEEITDLLEDYISHLLEQKKTKKK